MANYGVIDIGSNTIRFCVYEVRDNTQQSYTKKDFRTLLNNRTMAGLAAYVHHDVFTHAGIRRAVQVLKGHQKRLKYFNCVRVDAFATAALRNCSNSAEAVAAIAKETDFSITLLSATEEAHLGFVGASSEGELSNATLIDIGGGSTELTRIKNSTDCDSTSLPLGSLSGYTKHVKHIMPTKKEMSTIASSLTKKLRSLPNEKIYHHHLMYGIGGSIRAAAKVYAEAFELHESPTVLTQQNYDELLSLYAKDPDAFVRHILHVAPERIHTLLPGSLIAHTLMKRFGSEQLLVCSNGLREGYLIERMLLDAERAQHMRTSTSTSTSKCSH